MTVARDPEAIWHEVECGGYAADLAIWDAIAAEAAGPLVELGCGGGRVALHLARRGHEVVAVDTSPVLLAELRQDAAAAGLEIELVQADARELDLRRRFGAILAPMQFMHLFTTPDERIGLLEAVVAHLEPGGAFATALLAEDAIVSAQTGDAAPLPDVREHDGWVYSSLPIEVRRDPGGFGVRRLRQVVSPGGELTETIDEIRLASLTADQLEAEAAQAGLEPREQIAIAPTADHVGSVVCVLEASR